MAHATPNSILKDLKDNEATDKKASEDERLARARQIAIQHALSIEEKKNLHNKVLDMILTAYDLPSADPADPANPSSADVQTFLQCLALFRPLDLDESVSERNIDDRCGYALCKQPIVKQPPKKTWSAKGKLVEKKEEGQWCSKQCRLRNSYVRRQLSDEPAWLRQHVPQHITVPRDGPLLDQHAHATADVAETVPHRKSDTLTGARQADLEADVNDMEIIEKDSTKFPEPPTQISSDVLEGLPVITIARLRKQGGAKDP